MNVNIPGEAVQDSGKTGNGVHGIYIGIEEGTGRNWRSQKCECYDGCAELQSSTG